LNIFLQGVIFITSSAEAVLELRSTEGRANDTIKGLITVQLSTSDPTQTGSIAISNARRDIERGDIAKLPESEPIQAIGTSVNVVSQSGDIVTALGSVVSKLDLFVRIVDQAATVSARWRYIRDLL
jgi:hypothetical protein